MKAKVIKSEIQENRIDIGGYKHAFVMIACMAVLLDISVDIRNVPYILETKIFLKVFDYIEKKYSYDKKNHCLKIFKSNVVKRSRIPEEMTKQVHGTIYLLPVLLNLYKEIEVYETGGCRIGNEETFSTRPINHMFDVLKKFGARKEGGKWIIEDEFHSTDIDIMTFSENSNVLSGPNVSGATKTAIICALKAKEKVNIYNPYMKADVLEMLGFIEYIGGKYKYNGNKLTIYPINLEDKVYSYELVADVTEIITYIAFSQYHNVSVHLENIKKRSIVETSLYHEFQYIKKMGIKLVWKEDVLEVIPTQTIGNIGKIEINGESLYSDSQPFFLLMLLKSDYETTLIDNVWSNRFHYAIELMENGEPIRLINDNTAYISGIYKESKRRKRSLISKDLRGAACLLIYVSGTVGMVVDGVEHIERGYENFWEKLRNLGVEFEIEL